MRIPALGVLVALLALARAAQLPRQPGSLNVERRRPNIIQFITDDQVRASTCAWRLGGQQPP